MMLVVSAFNASAADMYTKAPPMMPVAYTWTGCYIGGNVGAGWSRAQTNDDDPTAGFGAADAGNHTATGIVGGGQIGCDYQFAPNWVVGAQGMFNGADVKGSHLAPFSYNGTNTETFSSKVEWFATATARLGFLVTPQTLLYVKGGGAWVRTSYADADPSGTVYRPFSGVSSANRTGWTIGAGGEYKFARNWSVFAEYNYADLGRKTSPYFYTCTGGCTFAANPFSYSNKHDLQTALVGVNYRF
jgi:outer membrane immunogenic protein